MCKMVGCVRGEGSVIMKYLLRNNALLNITSVGFILLLLSTGCSGVAEVIQTEATPPGSGPLIAVDMEPIHNKVFLVVVPTFNNEKYWRKNIDSILNQSYKNFRIVIIDDASTDDTYHQIDAYMKTHPMRDHVILHHNPVNLGQTANTKLAIYQYSKQDNEVVVTVDGDDWLLHNDVLKQLNRYYANKEVWLTYGSQLSFRRDAAATYFGEPMSREILEKGTVREHRFVASHLRTFYVGLFKQIKENDLLLNGENPKVTGDQFFMIPMVEMAGVHAYFNPDVSYGYNMGGTLHDFIKVPEKQHAVEKIIRTWKRYPPLDKLPGQFGSEKYLIVWPDGGLANRLRTLASAHVFAEKTNRKLILDWHKQDVFSADFDELFDSKIPTIEQLFKQTDVNSSEFKHLDPTDTDFMKAYSGDERVIYVHSGFNFTTPSLGFDEFIEEYIEFYRSLVFKPSIAKSVKEFSKNNGFNNGKVVGVHVRSWGLSNDDNRASIGTREAILNEFALEMQKAVTADPQILFFVATDNPDNIEKLRTKIGSDKILSYSNDSVQRSSLEDLKRAITEFLLLSKTRYIIGTYQSSFSEEAALLTQECRKINVGPSLVNGLHSIICFDKTGKPYQRPESQSDGCFNRP